MSAMDEMFANMIKKALPPEIVELMAPDKVQGFAERINVYLLSQAEFQQNTATMLVAIHERLERFENEYGKSGSGNDSGSNRRSGRGSKPDSGSGADA